MKSVSMKDMAEALNLSKTTVSWILAGAGKERGFCEETIRRVQDYAKKINYQPNLLARSLSTGTTNTIGLIIPFIGDTFYAQIAQHIEKEAQLSLYNLTICSSEGNSEHEIKQIRMLRSKQVDGLIIAPTKDSLPEIKRLKQDNFPFVLIDRYFPEVETNYIIVNNEESCYQLVTHLIRKKRRRIAILVSDPQLFVMQLRINGYRQALKDANIPFNDRLYIHIPRSSYKKSIVELLDSLFLNVPDVDAFFFANHYLALETLSYFIKRKIDYLNLYGLACFHETQALDILAPQMSISQMPIEQIGQKAVGLLVEGIKLKTNSCKSLILENSFFEYD